MTHTVSTLADLDEARGFFEKQLKFTVGPVEVQRMREAGQPFRLIDVRRKEDFVKSHVPGAVNLPDDQWDRIDDLARDIPNIFYCYAIECRTALKAAFHFTKKGFPSMEMTGGFESWSRKNLPVHTPEEKKQMAQTQIECACG